MSQLSVISSADPSSPVPRSSSLNVFLTGGYGFLGSILCPMLVEAGHRVLLLDRLTGSPVPCGASSRQADLLDVRPQWLEGFDAVIHLAGCSSDSAADADPSAAWRENLTAAEHLLRCCLAAGVPRFLQASTCSVYGFEPAVIADEDAPPRPVGPYSLSKLAFERCLLSSRHSGFHPFIFRMPTLHGWSPRMRSDLVINAMFLSALREGVIRVHNPDVWRPVLHVRDAASAYLAALSAPLDAAGTFNVHFDNFRLMDIASQVREAMLLRGRHARILSENRDCPRSYRVSSARVRRLLGVAPRFTVAAGICQLLSFSAPLLRRSSLPASA